MDKDDASSQESKEEISGFADQLASCLLKETLKDTGAGGGEQEGEWAIPCSSVCHQHSHAKEPDASSGVKSEKAKSGSGQLCWTPESGDSLVTSAVTGCSQEMMVTQEQESLRKGASVPNVSEENAEDEDIDRVSCSSEKSHRHRHRGIFFGFGLKSKPKSDTHSSGQHRPKMKNIKKTLSSLFTSKSRAEGNSVDSATADAAKKTSNLFKLPAMRNKTKSSDPCQRALPPVPPPRVDIPDPEDIQIHIDDGGRLSVSGHEHEEVTPQHSPSQSTPRSESDLDNLDFAASIERVKDRGWYWGPLSGEAAEKILSGEPDGSFVVRDSSDHHYIFSLTFKLNGFVRHVRIEHDQGNFSFGSFTRFKSTTIVDFIENAVEHSRSGRYLFFLHRRPVLGPMRVQLLHPVSRFKRVQSLQHLCRYVIVKVVRKDHLDQLPVPNRMKKYLNTPFYYSEQVPGNEEPAETQTLEQIEENVTNWDVVNEDDHEEVVGEDDHQAVERGEEQM